jgi:hypothetical protein
MQTVMAVAAIGALALPGSCGDKPAAQDSTSVALEPVNSATNPFMPPVGVDQANVTPPTAAGGSFSGNTAGLYGGTLSESSCDPGKLVAFLGAHADKAAAWAGVLGIQPSDIPTFVGDLTPTVLRSDTYVVNHGFESGRATAIPAVLQAGTAVLVDAYGFPVTKCFCGNPLARPTSFERIVYTGPTWASFSQTNITVIQSTTVVINQFTLVNVVTGGSFDRPRGTDGHQDGPPEPPPATLTPSPTGSGVSASSVPTAPASTGALAPPAPSPSPSVTPSETPEPPGFARSAPAPTTTAPPPGLAPPGSPSVIPAPPAPSTSTGSGPPASPTPSAGNARGAAPATASWVVGNCYADGAGTLHGTVLVRNNDPAHPHTYQVTVSFGSDGDVTTSLPSVQPGQTADAQVLKPGSDAEPGSTVACQISSIKDESGKTPPEGPPIAPPPDTHPTVTRPAPSTTTTRPGRTTTTEDETIPAPVPTTTTTTRPAPSAEPT